MRAGLRVVVAILVLTSFAATAQAGHHRRHHHHYARHSYGGGRVSGVCWTAARMGGPCGCEAAKVAFGQPIRDLWLVANWLRRFPRTGPQVGAAAIWGRHHVEIVTAVHGDGTVSTTGSVGHSHVAASRLTFVDPHGGSRYASRDGGRAEPHHYRHYASRHYGRGSYRVASSGQYSGTGYGGNE